MKIYTDSYLEIGASHNICEDYVFNGYIDGMFPYIIVCDGCSSSSATDVGARIVAHSCRSAMINMYHQGMFGLDSGGIYANDIFDEIEKQTLANMKACLDILKLPSTVCDATLMYAIEAHDHIHVACYGDGNVVEKRTNKENIWNSLVYESNAPFYLFFIG